MNPTSDSNQPGTLFLVSTPIGNLEDITIRALKVLRKVALVACEDTRHSAVLFKRFRIRTPRTSYHRHNEAKKCARLLEELAAGRDLALVSDAGTPGISDPGYRLVVAALEREIPVEAIPGPSAVMTALVLSGLSTERFAFLGFLPSRRGQRRRALEEVSRWESTLVLYESPHRVRETLTDLAAILGPERPLAAARELTKMYEEVIRGTAAEVLDHFQANRPIGEFTLVVGPPGSTGDAGSRAAPAMSERDMGLFVCWLAGTRGLGRREASERVSKLLGVSRKAAYQASLDADREDTD